MTRTRRRLRPWVIHTGEFMTGFMMALILMWLFCVAFEAFTGLNPLWLLGWY